MYASQLAQQSFLALDAGYEGLKQDAMSVGAAAAYAAVFPLEIEAALAARQQQEQQERQQEGAMALPPSLGNTSDTCFTSAELAHYSTDEFRMFAFKVFRCTKRFAHDWRTCPFSHPTENARRRDPNVYRYSAVACPDYKQGFCIRGELCPYAHGVFECWLHPSRYRTQLCKDGTACSRPLCFFAHSLAELRNPTHTWTPTDEELEPQPQTFPASPHRSGQQSVGQRPSSASPNLMRGHHTDPSHALSPSNCHKPLHHHHHSNHPGNNCAAASLGLTAPRMSNAFARRHGLNPKDNAMLNLQKIAIQQAQLANGGPASLATSGAADRLAGASSSSSSSMKGGSRARSSSSSGGGSSSRHHRSHHHAAEQLFHSSAFDDASQQQMQQQQQQVGEVGTQGGSALNHVAAATSVPSSAAAAATGSAAAAAASDSGASSNTSGTSSSHNSSMHLSNLSADSSGPMSSSGSGNGNSNSPLGMMPGPGAPAPSPSLMGSCDLALCAHASRQAAGAHYVAISAAASPPLVHLEAALNGGVHSPSTEAGCAHINGGHGGMMLPLDWAASGGGVGREVHADAATLAALQQHFQAFGFQQAALPVQCQPQLQALQLDGLGGMGMAGYGRSGTRNEHVSGVQGYGPGADRDATGMGVLAPPLPQQEHSHCQLLEEYMQGMQS